MNDLEQHLTNLLHDRAESTVVSVELDAVKQGAPARVAGGNNKALMGVAAATAFVVVGGLVALTQIRDTDSTDADPATESTASSPTNSAATIASGPQGAMVLPATTGMAPTMAESVASTEGVPVRWYSTDVANPESGPYLQITSAPSDPAASRPGSGCALAAAEPIEVTLDDGTQACLEPRPAGSGYGRLAMQLLEHTIVIEGSVTDAELSAAASNVLPATSGWGFEIAPIGLPDGVAESGFGATFSDFATTSGVSPQPTVLVHWDGIDGRSLIYVATLEETNATRVRRLGFETITDITIDGVPGFLRTLPDQPSYNGLVWNDNGVTYQVASQGLSSNELIALVEQLQPATQDDWNRMTAEAGANRAANNDVTATTIVEPGSSPIDTAPAASLPAGKVFGDPGSPCEPTVLDNRPDDDAQQLETGATCFLTEYTAGRPSTWDVLLPTDEGDPIPIRYDYDGTTVTITTDYSFDNFGSGGVSEQTCADVHATTWLPEGDDCSTSVGEGFLPASLPN